jgi:hypothetical protein
MSAHELANVAYRCAGGTGSGGSDPLMMGLDPGGLNKAARFSFSHE